ALLGKVLVGEVVLVGQPGDASLERALDGITGQVVGAVGFPLNQEHFRLGDADVGELLEVRPVHRTGPVAVGRSLLSLSFPRRLRQPRSGPESSRAGRTHPSREGQTGALSRPCWGRQRTGGRRSGGGAAA